LEFDPDRFEITGLDFTVGQVRVENQEPARFDDEFLFGLAARRRPIFRGVQKRRVRGKAAHECEQNGDREATLIK
jgi:hypothetical protein